LHGLIWLQQKVKEKDPVFFEKGEVQNPQRLMRALEVIEATGKSIISFRKGVKVKRDFRIIKIGLEISKEQLYKNIYHRTEEMINNGLIEEVRSLQQYRHLNALKTVGYAEIFQYLDQKILLSKAVEQINIHTRQYAKRQLTWFKKDLEYKWFHPSDLSGILAFCLNNT
jgi:tRNA dimethylallyltransferase